MNAPVQMCSSRLQEFGYGIYDGISGLVTQPLDGAKKEGFLGLIKGFGKGIGGVVLKPQAGEIVFLLHSALPCRNLTCNFF